MLYKQKILLLVEWLHRLFFSNEMSDTMRDFLKNLSWSFLGGIVYSVAFFIITILAGRILGPEEYGKYGLVVAVATIFIIPMTLGIDTASMHYIAKEKSVLEKNKYLNSALWVVAILIFSIVATVFLVISILSNFVFDFFSVSTDIIGISLILGTFLALRNVLDSFLRGFCLFKIQSVIKIVEASIIAILAIIMLNITDYGFVSFAGAVIIGYFFSVLIMILKLKSKFFLTNKYSKKLTFYGVYAVLGSVAGVLLGSMDKILINRFIGAEQLGIYNAYSSASVLVVGQIVFIFINVFFPYISAITDKKNVFKKINKLTKVFFIPIFLIMCFIVPVIIFLFGSQYPIDLILVLEFSLLSTLLAYFSVLWWLIAAEGRDGIKFTSINGIIAGLILIALIFAFKSELNLYLAVFFLIVSILYGVIVGNIRNIQKINREV